MLIIQCRGWGHRGGHRGLRPGPLLTTSRKAFPLLRVDLSWWTFERDTVSLIKLRARFVELNFKRLPLLLTQPPLAAAFRPLLLLCRWKSRELALRGLSMNSSAWTVLPLALFLRLNPISSRDMSLKGSFSVRHSSFRLIFPESASSHLYPLAVVEPDVDSLLSLGVDIQHSSCVTPPTGFWNLSLGL